LKAGEWFRRGRLLIASPVRQPFWLRSGRNSTYPTVQISRASSEWLVDRRAMMCWWSDYLSTVCGGDASSVHGVVSATSFSREQKKRLTNA
jgi:hypothetical protein